MRYGARVDVAPGSGKPLAPLPAHPEYTREHDSERQLDVSVVFTSLRGTLSALRKAGVLAQELGARITLVVPQIVPYPLPLANPPILLELNEKRFCTIARDSHVQTTVRIYLCRDRWDTLVKVLRPRSVVVIGGRKRWWPTAEMRLARKLSAAGYDVVFVETG